MPVTAITTTLGLTSLIEVEWGYPGLWIPNHGIINTTPTTYDLAIKLFEYQCLKYVKVLAHLTPWNLKDTQKNPYESQGYLSNTN